MTAYYTLSCIIYVGKRKRISVYMWRNIILVIPSVIFHLPCVHTLHVAIVKKVLYGCRDFIEKLCSYIYLFNITCHASLCKIYEAIT